jgi:putative glycosyltransferase (TIGR04372 family)
MGDPSMTSVAGLPGVIDYAHHPLKSPRLDVALCARARFFLGCTSGLALVGTAFGVPCVLANMIPIAALAIAPGDLSIPKLLWSEKEARHLRFEEILGSKIGSYYFTYLYERAGIRVLDNKDDEIRDLTAEMLDRLDGKFGETEEDRDLQRLYKALFKPGHYSYGAASRVGAAFLRKYKHLLA